MHPQHPFKILRRFMKGHPALKDASTQKGFAHLVGCSTSLIQAVEQRIKITEKLAVRVQAVTGVLIPWLSEMQDPDKPIPAAGGGTLTHEMVLGIIKQAIGQHSGPEGQKSAPMDFPSVLKGRAPLMASFVSGVFSSIRRAPYAVPWGQDQSVSWERRQAVTMARFVEDELFEAFSRGDYTLWDEISKVLSRYRPAVDPESGMPQSGCPSRDLGDQGGGDAEIGPYLE